MKVVRLTCPAYLVKDVTKKESEGGILYPDAATMDHVGEVVFVGQGRVLNDGSNAPLPASVGEHILFEHGHMAKIEHGGDTLILVHENSVLAIVEPDTDG